VSFLMVCVATLLAKQQNINENHTNANKITIYYLN